MNPFSALTSNKKQEDFVGQTGIETEISPDKYHNIHQIESLNQDENQSEQETSKQRQFNILNGQEIIQEAVSPEEDPLSAEHQNQREDIIINQKQEHKQSSEFQDVNLCNFESGDCEEILIECQNSCEKIRETETEENKVSNQNQVYAKNNKETENKQIGENQNESSELMFIPENVVEILKQLIHDSQIVETLNQSPTKQCASMGEVHNLDKAQEQKILNTHFENEIKVSQVFSSYETEEKSTRSPLVQSVIAQQKLVQNEKTVPKTNNNDAENQGQQRSHKQELVGFKVVVMLISIVLGYRFFSWVSQNNIVHSVPNLRFYLQIITVILVGIFVMALLMIDRSMKRKLKAEVSSPCENLRTENL